MKRLDKSPFLLNLLSRTSNFIASNKGFLPVLGIGFVILGFIFQVANVYTDNTLVELISVITHNVGVLTALIGVILIIPFGS